MSLLIHITDSVDLSDKEPPRGTSCLLNDPAVPLGLYFFLVTEAGHNLSLSFYRKGSHTREGKGLSRGYIVNGSVGELGHASFLFLSALPLPMTCRDAPQRSALQGCSQAPLHALFSSLELASSRYTGHSPGHLPLTSSSPPR